MSIPEIINQIPAKEADAEEEGEEDGGRRRARDVRRDARQAEREMQANRMRKKDVSPCTSCTTPPSCTSITVRLSGTQ